ncbi:MAG: BLUF domain-containing protein [Comamonadaceae bacterium]|nr:MAG: BLUF domain-containing protein [Comamonadaceae bacterium]
MSSIALSHFIYCSLLSADAAPTCVADIIRTSRPANAERHITGVLVFDGERFCQYIEGPAERVAELAERIGKDTRHTDFTPLHHAPLLDRRRFQDWSMAYALAPDVEPLERMHRMRGLPAVELLDRLIPDFDLGPAVAA